MPTLEHFQDTLQYKQPECFRVQKNTIPRANRGLFFKGKCFKHDLICGYPGELKKFNPKNFSHYSAKLGTTKMLIDATIYKDDTDRYIKR